MAYIGSTPTSQNFISGTDYFNGDGSTVAFTLTRSVNSVNDVEVVVNNVVQLPSSYTVSGTTLTLSAAPSSGTSNVYVRYLATNQQSFTVGNNTVGYNQLTSDMQSKFAMKNRIINGAMMIDQRNAGASVTATTANLYTVDRWQAISTVSSKYSFQQNAGSVTPPVGFSNYLGCTSLSAYSIGSTDQFMIQQGIEGFNIADLAWGTASAKTVTLSFQVYSSLTGTFGGAVRNGTSAYAYPFTYTISSANTWTTVSITIAGPTSGTWNTTNSGGIYLTFSLGVGSTYSATAGSWTAASNIFSATGATSVVGTNGATFYITGVQLEVGSSATGFEYRQYGTELSLCQRYCYVASAEFIGAVGNNGYVVGGALYYPQPMRTTPSFSNGSFTVNTGSAGTFASQGATNRSVQLFNSAGNWTGGSGPANIAYSATISAEL